MPANPELPSWMGDNRPPQPPPPPPPGFPPPGYAPPGYGGSWPGPPPPPPQSSGFLTTVAVLNLLFALVCGCFSGLWAKGWQSLRDEPDQVVAALDENRDEIRLRIRESFSRERDRELTAEERAALEQAFDPENLKAAIVAVSQCPAVSPISTATLIAAIAQAGLFVGSILLLSRSNLGRMLSMLSLAAYLAATGATIVKFSSVGDAIGAEVSATIPESPSFKQLKPEVQREVSRAIELIPEATKGFVGVVGAGTMVWPAISLLILLASRGIRDACRKT